MELFLSLNTQGFDQLPEPKVGMSRVSQYAFRPDLIYKATVLGDIDQPRTKSMPVDSLLNDFVQDYHTLASLTKHRMVYDLQTAKVATYVKLYKDGSKAPVMCIQSGRKFFVIDGNHRVTAAHYAGLKSIDIVYWNLSDVLDKEVLYDRRSKPHPLCWKL